MLLFTINCKGSDKQLKIKDFMEFMEVFKKAVKGKDKNIIYKLVSPNFHYSTYDFRDKWNTRTLALENFDFELAENLLNYGYEEDIHSKSGKFKYGYCPPMKENILKMTKGYVIYFKNEGKGWKIDFIFQGPVGEDKIYEKKSN